MDATTQPQSPDGSAADQPGSPEIAVGSTTPAGPTGASDAGRRVQASVEQQHPSPATTDPGAEASKREDGQPSRASRKRRFTRILGNGNRPTGPADQLPQSAPNMESDDQPAAPAQSLPAAQSVADAADGPAASPQAPDQLGAAPVSPAVAAPADPAAEEQAGEAAPHPRPEPQITGDNDARVPTVAEGAQHQVPRQPHSQTEPTPETLSPLRVFGRPANLGPIPRKVAAPGRQPVPPDIAIEWADVPRAAIRGVSARGHLKRYEGELRQDAMALGSDGDYLWIAVADGVGSAPLSHVGSAQASLAAATGGFPELRDQASRALAGDDALLGAVELPMVAGAVRRKADDANADPRELSTTLVLAAVPIAASGPVDVVVWQIGDSPVGRIAAGSLTILEEGDDEGLSNSAVAALPLFATASIRVERFNPGETLVLMTDGVSNAALANDEYRTALAQLWQESAPTPAALLQVVDGTVRSFDDDRTFVGIRFSD